MVIGQWWRFGQFLPKTPLLSLITDDTDFTDGSPVDNHLCLSVLSASSTIRDRKRFRQKTPKTLLLKKNKQPVNFFFFTLNL
ncbi:MAG: hypothetical protein MUD08_13520, partial [Cytophagales bacterium]|nr:hypothetical protein [Cytophagales bacterium]